MSNIITCLHGIRPKGQCLDCKRDHRAAYKARREAGIPLVRKGPLPILCSHGVLGKSKCRECVTENAAKRREAKRGSRPKLGSVPCHHGNKRYTCLLCKAEKQAARRTADPERGREASRRAYERNPDRYRDSALLTMTKRRMQPGAQLDRTVTLSALIARDGNICWLCGLPCNTERGRVHVRPDAPTCDHVLPLSRHGDHVWENVRLAHRACNLEKRDDVCESCGGPISELGEPICAKCVAKGRKDVKQTGFAVCGQCGHIEWRGGYCSNCKAKGSWVATGLTKRAANELSKSLGLTKPASWVA